MQSPSKDSGKDGTSSSVLGLTPTRAGVSGSSEAASATTAAAAAVAGAGGSGRDEMADATQRGKGVQFGSVEIRLYPRLLGGSGGVPSEGVYALGLDWPSRAGGQFDTVDEHVEARRLDREATLKGKRGARRKAAEEYECLTEAQRIRLLVEADSAANVEAAAEDDVPGGALPLAEGGGNLEAESGDNSNSDGDTVTGAVPSPKKRTAAAAELDATGDNIGRRTRRRAGAAVTPGKDTGKTVAKAKGAVLSEALKVRLEGG